MRCPVIKQPIQFRQIEAPWYQVSDQDATLKFFCSEHEAETSLKAYSTQIEQARQLWVLTGPEGGLAQEESHILATAGWHSVTFGPTIVRAETAPLVALAQIQVLAGG